MTDWSLVGGDPAPDSMDAIYAVAAQFISAGALIAQASRRLTGAVGNLSTVWTDSDDASAFAMALAAPQAPFDSARAAISDAVDGCGKYLATLQAEQPLAADALQRAHTAHVFIVRFLTERGPSLSDPSDPQYTEARANLARAKAAISQVRTAVAAANAAFQHAGADAAEQLASLRVTLGQAPAPSTGSLSTSGAYFAYEDMIRQAAANGPPQFPANTAEVAAYWDSLDPDLRAAYVKLYPQLIGNRDGVAIADRSTANEARANADIASIDKILSAHGVAPIDLTILSDAQIGFAYKQMRLAGLTDDQLKLYFNAEVCLDGLTLNQKYTSAQTYLMVYDPMAFNGKGRAAIAIGDPDTAGHVAVCVDGLNSTLQNTMGSTDAQYLYNAAKADDPDNLTAVVQWMGYDAPGFSNVASHNAARNGATYLVSDVGGLQASHVGDNYDLTVIGHSYGSTTVADAAVMGMRPTNIVLIGSPGTDLAKNATDLGLPPGHVFVGAASRDPVTFIYATSAGAHIDPLGVGVGVDPANQSFGAVRFDAEAVNRDDKGWENHSLYYQKGSESLYNLSDIATGNAAHLNADGQLAQSRYWSANGQEIDPEQNRTPVGGLNHAG
jgi:hypothetical protein